MPRRNIAIFWLTFLFMFMETMAETVSNFHTYEHEVIGSKFSLPMPPEMGTTLTLPNGLQLTFGQIVALAGDYYGVPGSPTIDQISPYLPDKQGRRKRFLAHYDTLARVGSEDAKKQVMNLVRMIEEDKANVRAGNEDKLHTDEDWDEATGGNWLLSLPAEFGGMMHLAVDNYDHFQPQAAQAYLVGHKLAIEKARQARTIANQTYQTLILMEAYSMDAFAGHFLTDCFSAGHIRTPRVQLQEKVSPSTVGDFLSKLMHDEDCEFGLRVTNKKGDRWNAYGDKFLLEIRDTANYRRVVRAMKASVAQVHEAFQYPGRVINSTEVTDIIPFVDDRQENNSPLFQMKNGLLLRRESITNLQDTRTDTDWLGWTTAVEGYSKSYQKTNSALPLILGK